MYIKNNRTWASDHLKSSDLLADNFQKTFELSGSTPDTATLSGDTG